MAFEAICRGKYPNSPILKLDNAARFRWLTATHSTILQTSTVHPGLCEDPEVTLEKLVGELGAIVNTTQGQNVLAFRVGFHFVS